MPLMHTRSLLPALTQPEPENCYKPPLEPTPHLPRASLRPALLRAPTADP